VKSGNAGEAAASYFFPASRTARTLFERSASDSMYSVMVPAIARLCKKLTGYIRGGVTSLAAKKTYPVYADKSIERSS
jgi:hypothetical protein